MELCNSVGLELDISELIFTRTEGLLRDVLELILRMLWDVSVVVLWDVVSLP